MKTAQRADGLSFGERAAQYHIGRKGYPPFILEQIEMETEHVGEAAVDVGCGTGIASRQLSDHWRVTGVDLDVRMLFVARYVQATNETGHPIVYKQGRAGKLPLKGGTQRLVACFGAFHYFATAGVVAEFKRTLVPGGTVAVAHQSAHEEDHFETAWRSVVAFYIDGVPKRHKDEIRYNPRLVAQLLRDGGFVGVKGRKIGHVERYTIPEAVARVQSMTHWKWIPGQYRREAEKALRLAFESLKRKGEDTVIRETDAWAVIAKKPL